MDGEMDASGCGWWIWVLLYLIALLAVLGGFANATQPSDAAHKLGLICMKQVLQDPCWLLVGQASMQAKSMVEGSDSRLPSPPKLLAS